MHLLTRNDGIHARMDELGSPFRFRLGSGKARRTSSDPLFLWVIEGEVGDYLLQFIPHVIALRPRPELLAILESHFHWEMGFLRERLGVTVDEGNICTLDHPAGTPILTWISRNPVLQSALKPGLGIPDGRGNEQFPDSSRRTTTPFSAHASFLHLPDHLLHFVVTGGDSPWTEEELRTQVLRSTLSYFPLDHPKLSTEN